MNIDPYSDIAAFYDYGNNTTQIHVWKSNGSSFNNPEVWWNTTGYNASNITNRVVSGSFNNDNLTDIAAFYDNGNGTTNLHVWLSNGTGYTYQWSTGWWSESSGNYQVSKITGKVVSGDYNGDGKSDIAAFYDDGIGLTKLQVWLSNGSNGFVYQGNTGWWSAVPANFDASKITGRVVSNDFNSDGKSDIAAFYDNGSGGTSLRIWLSNGSSFSYQGDAGWWDVNTGYDANKLTGRVVTGNFDKESNNDIMGFFDYNYAGGSLRTHVWQKKSGNLFEYINESLGYPWLTGFIYDKSLVVDIPSDETEAISEATSSYFSVYPNPSSTFLQINGLNPAYETSITILDLTGKVISNYTDSGDQIHLSAEHIPSGNFIVRIINGENVEFKKIFHN